MSRRHDMLFLAAQQQNKVKQLGVKLGHDQIINAASTTRIVSKPICIGVADFSLEFFGSTFGSTEVDHATLFNAKAPIPYSLGSLFLYAYTIGQTGIGILFEGPGTTDSFQIDRFEVDPELPFHLVITRSGKNVKVYLNGSLTAMKEQSSVKNIGEFQIGLANSSYVGFVRLYNYALLDDEVTTLFNAGNPSEYVIPSSMKYALLAASLMQPMVAEDWRMIYNTSPTPEITQDGSLKLYFNSEPDMAYEGGCIHYSETPYIYNTGTVLELRFMAKTDVAGQTFRAGLLNYPSGALYINNKIIGTTEWSEYVVTGLNNFSRPINGIYFFPEYNTPGKGAYYIKDVKVIQRGCIAEYLSQNLVTVSKGKKIDLDQSSFVFDIGSPYSISVISGIKFDHKSIFRMDYVVEEWNYQPAAYSLVGFLGLNGALVSGDTIWPSLAAAKVGKVQTLYIIFPGDGYPSLRIYGGQDMEATTSRHLKVTIKNIVAVDNIVSFWLDSAKQLPMNNNYLPPLLQSFSPPKIPISITNDKSYTWYGVDSILHVEKIFNQIIIPGTTLKVKITVSEYEAGSPFFMMPRADAVYIPAENGTYEFTTISATKSDKIILSGGKAGTDRRLTLTLENIELINNFDMTSDGTPKIINGTV